MGLPVLAGDAPHEESPAHIEPSTIILSPAGILTVVPALIISLAPSTTVRLPLRFTVPDQVSDVVISPEVVTALVHFEQPQQPYDEDDHSGEIREYNGVFEGPEKTLGKLHLSLLSAYSYIASMLY